MTPSILVLTDLSAAAEQAAYYAAVLGAPLSARLTLLHLYQYPIVLDLTQVASTTAKTNHREAEVTTALRALAQHLPGSAQVAEEAGAGNEAVEEAVAQYHPLLLAMGLSPEHNLLDHVLHNHVLPVIRATHRPLLLVPAGSKSVHSQVPRRVLLALDAEPFTLNAAALALAPLFRAWQANYTVAHVTTGEEPVFAGSIGLADIQSSGLLPPGTPLAQYQPSHLSAATGVLQAIKDTGAELLVLIARPRSFLGALFHQSITAQVLLRSPVPVLLLPAEATEMPGWMPPGYLLNF